MIPLVFTMVDKSVYRVLGLMSGTSLDGLDLCLVSFQRVSEQWQFDILDSKTVAYEERWVQKISEAHNLTPEELLVLDEEFGQLLGEQARLFIDGREVDLVASHGHTIFHDPDNGITTQIGSAQEIAKHMNIPIISDFRSADVKLGGQGAPLVPIGDQDLFSDYSSCLNLGGFGNASFDENGERIAFDICAVNFVLNRMVQKIGLGYDEGGEHARAGVVNVPFFNKLNELSFFKMPPPKSLGREWVQAEVDPLIKEFGMLSVEDHLATFCEHVGFQIGASLNQQPEVFVTGGGAFNTFLMERIRFHLPKSTVVLPPNRVIDSKEALVFAYLGLKRARGEVNVLASVTGALRDHSSGKVDFPESDNKIEIAD